MNFLKGYFFLPSLTCLCILSSVAAVGQTYILQENFEGSFPPPGWIIYADPNAASGWTQGPTYPLIDPCVPQGAKTMTSQWATYYPNDTWAFTPGQYLTAGIPYVISFAQCVKSPSNNKTENLKVTVGTGANYQSQNITLLNLPSLTNTSPLIRTATFTPQASGTYYFAFHCYSIANQRYLSIDDVKISYNNGCTNTTHIAGTICQGNTYNFHGNLLTASGIYYDTLLNTQGCDSTVVLSLTVNSAPNTTVSQNGTTLVSNENNATYQWMECNNNILISGATGSSYTAVSNGLYAVILNKNGCIDTSACYTINTLSADQVTVQDFIIYPNPVQEVIYINGKESIEQVRILNLMGQQVFFQPGIYQQNITIDFSHFPVGMYLLEITHEKGKVIRQIVKQ